MESEGLQSQIEQQKQALMQKGNEEYEESEEYPNSEYSNQLFSQNPGQSSGQSSGKMPFFTKNLPIPPPLPPQLMAK